MGFLCDLYDGSPSVSVLVMVQKSGDHHLAWCKNPGNNGINYQPQLVIAGFLNHQQYLPDSSPIFSYLLSLIIVFFANLGSRFYFDFLMRNLDAI